MQNNIILQLLLTVFTAYWSPLPLRNRPALAYTQPTQPTLALISLVTQMQEIHSGGSYLSRNDLRVHFGSGPAEKISTVEIRWPSGKVENLEEVAADHFLFRYGRGWHRALATHTSTSGGGPIVPHFRWEQNNKWNRQPFARSLTCFANFSI